LYIDVFQNGIRQTSIEVQAKSDTNPENFENAKPSEVFQRIVSHVLLLGVPDKRTCVLCNFFHP
jgi:hypothetical protein